MVHLAPSLLVFIEMRGARKDDSVTIKILIFFDLDETKNEASLKNFHFFFQKSSSQTLI